MLNVLHTCILEALRHKNIMPGLLPGWTERILNNCLIFFPLRDEMLNVLYTPISRKVVGKSARDNSERYCGRFWVLLSSKKFERMAQETMDLCFQMLKESNNRRFNRYSVRNSVLIKSHITFRDCRVHIFSDNLSWTSCILGPFRHNNIMPELLPGWTERIEQLPNFYFRLRVEMLNVLYILEPLRHNDIMPGLLPGWTRKDIEKRPDFFFQQSIEMLNVLFIQEPLRHNNIIPGHLPGWTSFPSYF